MALEKSIMFSQEMSVDYNSSFINIAVNEIVGNNVNNRM